MLSCLGWFCASEEEEYSSVSVKKRNSLDHSQVLWKLILIYSICNPGHFVSYRSYRVFHLSFFSFYLGYKEKLDSMNSDSHHG